jgi:hypothetical protein
MSSYNSNFIYSKYYQVCTPKTGRFMGPFLLLAFWLFAFPTWSAPFQQPAWKKNMKVSVEIGFGMPYGWLLDGKEYKDEGSTVKIQVNSSWRFGVVCGYGFPFLNDTLAVGPDIGLSISTKRKFRMLEGNVDVAIEEQYLHIPVAVKLATVDSETGFQEDGVTLGYEFNILRSSTKWDISTRPKASILKKVEGIAKSLSKLSGSIFLGGKVDLFEGCYLMGQFRLPITDLAGYVKSIQNNDEVKCRFYIARCLNAPLVELSLGVNIMKWLL